MKKTLRDYTIAVLDCYFTLRNTPGRKKTNKDWEFACQTVHVTAREEYPDLKEFKSAIAKDRKELKKEREKMLQKAASVKERRSAAILAQGSLFPLPWSARIMAT